jgi:lysophospholipase L1-like esterase
MRKIYITLLITTFISAIPVLGTAAGSPPVKKSERIVFFGDSITRAGTMPDGYITLIGDALEQKHKEGKVKLINGGVSGDRVPDLQRRVQRDVIAQKPSTVFIYIGINDVWQTTFWGGGTPKDEYESGLKELCKKITDTGAGVILCTPSVIGEKRDGSNRYDKMLDDYAAISRKVAKELHLPLCDLRKAFIEYLRANNPQNRDEGILTYDGVHLNDAGNRLVAGQMLPFITK